MTSCHRRSELKFVWLIFAFASLLVSIWAADGVKSDFLDDLKGKRAGQEKIVVPDSQFLNVKPVLPKLSRGVKLEGKGVEVKINSGTAKVGDDFKDLGRDLEYEDDTEDEKSDGNYKGVVSPAASKRNKKRHDSSPAGQKIWDHWGKWSSCSVTCGVGKMTRWRHCVSGTCSTGEKEAQIKTCTLAAC